MKKIVLSLTALLVACSSLVSVFMTQHAAAASFDPNRIIDDKVFSQSNTMSPVDIDQFLNSFPSSCISIRNGFLAIDPAGYSPSTGYQYGGNVTAGQVIYDASQAYDLNPRVLLVTLQKEQSLVNGGAGCTTKRYTAAVGYGCPDSGTTYSYSNLNLYTLNGVTNTSVAGTCVNSALKAGFTQQVIRAAWLLKFGQQRALGNMNWAVVRGNWNNSDDLQSCYSGPVTPGMRQVCPSSPATYYDGYRTIDGTSVRMTTGATAALYWYTPHLHGNQNFFDLYVNWFGLPFSNDTDTPHPNGAVVSDGQKIYLIQGAARHHVLNPSVFASYGYSWNSVKPASSGDMNLPVGSAIDTLAPGTIFTTNTGKVYVMEYISGVLKKQWISSATFQNLGYRWDKVLSVPAGYDTAPEATGVYTSNRHPSGTLILSNGVTYQLDASTKQPILGPVAFASHRYDWETVHYATAEDSATPTGSPIDIETGTMLLSNGTIWVTDYDLNGINKRPVGPYECYVDRLHYNSSDWISVAPAALPTRTQSIFTC